MLILTHAGILSAPAPPPQPGGPIQAGTGDSRANPKNGLTPGWPTDILAGDDLYLHVSIYSEDLTSHGLTTPAGWTLVQRQVDPSSLTRQWIYHRDAAGDEAGTHPAITWSAAGPTGTRIAAAQIVRARGHTAQDVVGGGDFGAGTVLDGVALTVAGAAQALMFGAIRVAGPTAPAIADVIGETGGEWSEVVEAQLPQAERSMTLVTWTSELAGAGTIAGGTASSTITGDWSTTVIAAGAETEIAGGGNDDDLPAADETIIFDDPPYNGVADDSTDNRAAFVALWNYLEGKNPNTITHVQFSAGIYLTGPGGGADGTLTLQDAENFHFLGNGATIARHPSWHPLSRYDDPQARIWHFTTCFNWSLRDFTIDGRRDSIPPDSSQHHNVRVLSGADMVFKRITTMNAQGDGWQFNVEDKPSLPTWQPPHNILMEDCTFRNNYRVGMALDYGGDAIFRRCLGEHSHGVDPSSGMHFECQNNAGGPTVSPYPGWPVGAGIFNVLVQACTMRKNSSVGFNCGGNDGTIHSVEIDSCVFEDNKMPQGGFESNKRACGAWIRNVQNFHIHDCDIFGPNGPIGPSGTLMCLYVHDKNDPTVTIEDNTIHPSNTGQCVGIGMRDLGEGSNLVTIRRNTINLTNGSATGGTSGESNGPCGIAIQWSNVDCVDNIIQGPGSTGGFRGIMIEKTRAGNDVSPNGATVTGNTIEDCDIGIEVTHGAGTYDDLEANNTFVDCGDNVVE